MRQTKDLHNLSMYRLALLEKDDNKDEYQKLIHIAADAGNKYAPLTYSMNYIMEPRSFW